MLEQTLRFTLNSSEVGLIRVMRLNELRIYGVMQMDLTTT